MQIFSYLLNHFFFIILVLSVGSFIFSKVNFSKGTIQTKLGEYYFFGVIFLGTGTRLIDYVFNNTRVAAFFVVTICLITIPFSKIFNTSNKTYIFYTFFKLIFLWIGIASLLLIYWNDSILNIEDPHSSIGTLHAVRYAWLSNFIGEFNFIPVVGQNSFQSILTFISSLIYGPAPFLYLFLWLSSSIFFLGLYVYGILSEIIQNNTGRVLGLIIFMMGQTAFSFTHVLTIDAGSPFLFTGYTDTIIGIFSVLVFFKLYSSLISKKKLNKKIALIILLVVLSNFLYAPQNIIFLVASFFLLLMHYLIKKNNRTRSLGVLATTLFISFLIMTPLGGMLTPSYFFTEISYSGILKMGSRLEISPGIGFHYGWVGNWEFGLTNLTNFAKNITAPLENIEFLNKLPWHIEQIVFTSLRVHFFTIIGLIFLFLYSNYLFLKNNTFIEDPDKVSLLKNMSIFGILFFIIGFTLAFPFSLNDNKWALTRFLLPAITIGMFGNAIVVGKIIEYNRRNIFRVLIIIFILFFSLFGPMINSTLIIVSNGLNLYDQKNYKINFNHLLSSGPEVFSYNCNDVKCKNYK
jgi:hypothetical protein